jgi:formylglycine-generating enzyme required for sulfatase activity
LESGATPFAGVDLALATHHHADHFDAQAVAAHLSRNPQALFISTPQSVEKLKAVGGFEGIKDRVVAASPGEGERIARAHRGVNVQMLNIHHGRNRPVQNLGFIVEIGGKKLLHIGDSEAEDFVFKNYSLVKDNIDVAFIPYWYFFDSGWKRAVHDQIRAKRLVLMHIPPKVDQFDSQVRKLGGWTKVWAGIKAEFPNAVYFERELVSMAFTEQESSLPTKDLAFVKISAGEFMMGSANGEDNEMPAHRVMITHGFEIAKYEVTQAQWEAVMGASPSRFKGANLPVEQVSWDDVQSFIRVMNAKNDGYEYRLPTEAEWEYAARAGADGDYAGNLSEMGWYSENSGGTTHPVGTKKPNAWGIYDMHGNVWELCQDWYDKFYYKSGPTIDPRGPETGSTKSCRGGCYSYDASRCKSASRGHPRPDARYDIIGFRLVRMAR